MGPGYPIPGSICRRTLRYGGGRLVSRYFSAFDRLGIIRLRESHYYRPELQLDEFISALQEMFPPKAETNAEGN